MIKVIAFDFVGVLAFEKDINLTIEEEQLEKLFGPNLNDNDYLNKVKSIIENKTQIIKTTKDIINKLYEIKDKDIFKIIKHKYPNIKLIIATNHLSYIKEFINKSFDTKYIDDIIISAEINKIKPNNNFYEHILNKYNINPNELLFIDDNITNINSANNMNINTIKINKNDNLLENIINNIEINNNYYKAYEERYRKVHNQGILWEYINPSPVVLDFLTNNNANKDSKILDLGCGEGRDAIYLLKKGYNILAVDYSKSAINKCNELTNNKYINNFKTLDIFKNKLNTKFDYIYSISVLHMFVLDEHRNNYYKFIYNHLEKNGKALITILGDGIKEKKTDINDAFKIVKRNIQQTNKTIMVTNTSCRIVNWNTLETEINKNNLKIEKKWISNNIPGFNESMCIIISKGKE